MYVAEISWQPGLLRMRMDEQGEIFPVAKPDPDDLERFMFETDSPYDHRRTSDGGIEILAKGRSAVTLLVWLEEIVRPAVVRSASRFRDRITMNKCPFNIGEFVVYRPSAVGADKSVMTDLASLKPGARYKVSRIDKEVYVVIEGHEGSPAGGLYWTEFERTQ